MEVQAVVDRFEEDRAVLLVGEEEEQLVVPRAQLPAGVKEGDWLRAHIQGDVLLSATIDDEETARARSRIADKLERLRRGKHLS